MKECVTSERLMCLTGHVEQEKETKEEARNKYTIRHINTGDSTGI